MFLTIKKIPKVSWSSDETFNLKPKLSTLFFLCFGLILFGFGEALVVISFLGNSPWTVMAQGISIKSGLSIGVVTFIVSVVVLSFVSVVVLSLWFFLKQKPGLGTIFNIVIIAVMLDVTIALIPTPETYIMKLLMAALGVMIVGVGSGIYLIANLGPGPRDGLMTGLQKKTNLPIAAVRAFIEISVASVGWYLGGTLGVGTLMFAFGIGPCIALSLYLIDKMMN